MSSRHGWILAVLALGVCGFLLGRVTLPEPKVDVVRRLEAASVRIDDALGKLDRPCIVKTSEDVAGADLSDSTLRNEIRMVLREELRTFIAQSVQEVERTSEGEQEPSVDSSAADGEQVAAYDRGHFLVKRAMSSRLWGEEQVAEMRTILPRLSSSQRRVLLHELLGAISRGEINSQGPPL